MAVLSIAPNLYTRYMTSIFSEVGAIIVVAAFCALLARLFKQPPLLGYIVAGIALGPLGFGLVHQSETLDAMRQIGIALLLFLVGLELDWSKARQQLHTASITALIQALGSFLAGIFLTAALGLPLLTGVYVGIILAFSSTVIVIKFLSESRDLNSLHGRLSVGILLVQDLIAIAALVLLNGITGNSSIGVTDQLILLVVKVAALLSLVWILSQYILPPLFARIARSTELLFMSSLAWCFCFAILMKQFDFPLESGAFLAGLTLASLPYGLDIVNRLRSLRDFFVVIFFVSLGISLQVPGGSYILLTTLFLLFTVLAKPIITFFCLTSHGYRSRTAFLTGLTQSQLSEFSLIIITIGISRGSISGELASALTFTAIISILISTVLLGARNSLFHWLKDLLHLAERKHRHNESFTAEMEERLDNHIIIFGYHRMGYHILKKLHQLGHHVVVVDFNPDIIQKLRDQNIDCVYGDVEDEDIFEAIHLERASMVVSTIPHHEETTYLIQEVKKRKGNAKLIVTAHDIDNALHYYQVGADYVILPHLLGGEHVADLISRYQDHNLGQYMRHRAEELKLLRARNHALYFD